MAFHELAHALAGIVLGGIVNRVVLGPGNPACSVSGVKGMEDAILCMAGPQAEGLARGVIRSVSEPFAVASWSIVNMPGGGFCDWCRAFRPCVQRVGIDRKDEALGLFREIERAAFRLVDHPASRDFLRVAASELIAKRELQGERIHEIADEILSPTTLIELRNLVKLES